MRDGRRQYLIWASVLAAGLLLSLLYFRVWMPVEQGSMDKDLFQRRIGSPVLQWMNGFLGPFLNLDYQGVLSWLALPVLGWWIFRPGRDGAWKRAVGLLVAGAALVIGAFGGFNPRYGFTLNPVLLAVAFIGVWEWMGRRDIMWLRRGTVLASLVVLQFINLALNVDYRVRVWRVEKAQRAVIDGKSHSAVVPAGQEGVQQWLASMGVADTTWVLVNNLPEFWYGSSRRGIYYWCGSDQVFSAEGPVPLFEGRTDGQVAQHLNNDLHCDLILTTHDLSTYDKRFMSFLLDHCTLAGKGPRSLLLYKVN
jgi:hypothetical protein